MKWGWAGLLAAVLLTGAGAPAPTRGDYRLIDLSGDFTRVYDATAGQPDAARFAAFEHDIVPRFPEFYGRARYKDMDTAAYQARIVRAFHNFGALRPAYQATETSFTQSLDPAIHTFRARLPDLGPIGDIYLLHSLGEMDGGTRNFRDGKYFIFGADVMAQLHSPGSERPFFHHELFHIYHQQFFHGCEAVWCSLWSEGLAVFAAHELNPGADEAQLLLNVPEPIPAAVDAHLTEAVCAVRARLHSTTNNDRGALLSFNRLNHDLPPRFGYYVGYLMAREASHTHTLQQLAHLPDKDVLTVLEASLAALATCPAN